VPIVLVAAFAKSKPRSTRVDVEPDLAGSRIKSRELGLRHVAESLDRHAQALLGLGWKVGQGFECEAARDFHADQRFELRILAVVSDTQRFPRGAANETAFGVE
jgi:hypothetical protein